MSNTSSDHLHQLVRSMSKSEKRYFKLYLRRNGEERNQHFELLFDYLVKEVRYDEAALLEEFKGEKYVKRFSVTKNRLYNHVLSSLETFHASADEEIQLQRSLHQVSILSQRGLQRPALKLLSSIRRTAAERELPLILLRAEYLLAEIHECSGFEVLSAEDRQEHRRLVEKSIGDINRHLHALDVKTDIFERLYDSGKSLKGSEEVEGLKKKLDSVQENSDDTVLVKHHVLHARAALAFMQSDHIASLELLKENIDLLKGAQHIELPRRALARLLSNAVYECSRLQRPNEAADYLDELREEVAKDSSAKSIVLLRTTELAFIQLNDTIDEGRKMLRQLDEALSSDDLEMTPRGRCGLYFGLAGLQLAVGDSRSALRSLNEVLNGTSMNESEDMFCNAQLLHLLAHVDLDHREYLPYAVKSLKRRLVARDRLHQWEMLFLTLASTLAKSNSPEKDEEAYLTFVEEGRRIRKDKTQKVSLEYFDYLAWAEHKLESLRLVGRMSA